MLANWLVKVGPPGGCIGGLLGSEAITKLKGWLEIGDESVGISVFLDDQRRPPLWSECCSLTKSRAFTGLLHAGIAIVLFAM